MAGSGRGSLAVRPTVAAFLVAIVALGSGCVGSRSAATSDADEAVPAAGSCRDLAREALPDYPYHTVYDPETNELAIYGAEGRTYNLRADDAACRASSVVVDMLAADALSVYREGLASECAADRELLARKEMDPPYRDLEGEPTIDLEAVKRFVARWCHPAPTREARTRRWLEWA